VGFEDVPSGMFSADIPQGEGVDLEFVLKDVPCSVSLVEETQTSLAEDKLNLSTSSVELPMLPEEGEGSIAPCINDMSDEVYRQKEQLSQPTPAEVKRLAIMCLLQQWNCQTSTVACCSFHAALTELCDLSFHMLTTCKCIRKFQLEEEVFQCSTCALLAQQNSNDEQLMCDLCNRREKNKSTSNPNHKSMPTWSGRAKTGIMDTTFGKQCMDSATLRQADASERFEKNEPAMPHQSPTNVSMSTLALTNKPDVIAMLRKWCFPCSKSDCCTFHTALQDLRATCLDMKFKSECTSTLWKDADSSTALHSKGSRLSM